MILSLTQIDQSTFTKIVTRSFVTVDKVEGDVENKKLYVTTDKSTDDLLTQIQKTGKAVSYVGPVS